MLKRKRNMMFATALLAAVAVGGSGLSTIAQERAFPTGKTHATPDMIEANPDLF